MKIKHLRMFTALIALAVATVAVVTVAGAATRPASHRPKGPCDIYTAAGDPCVAAYSTTRAMYASYSGPLYQVRRQSDGKFLNIGVTPPSASSASDSGYADAAAQDQFCANTYCWITRIYDQSPKHNDLTQAPRGGWSGPALGGMDNVPLANMAPVMVMGHKVYGVFIEPGMGLRDDDPKGTAVDDQAEGEYWVINGKHFNSGCCYDFGNAEIDSRDDDAGTMETAYFGDAPYWYHGNPPGPWVMTDQENNLVGCVNADGSNHCANLPNIHWRFVTAIAKGEPHHWSSMGGDAQHGPLQVMFSGPRVDWQYDPMRKQGAILLGNGGDNSNGSQGTFYEGAMTAAGTFPSNATDQQLQANIVAAHYRMLPLSIAPSSATAAPPGLQTFSPRSSQSTTVTFTNTANAPATKITLSLSLPDRQWSAKVNGTSRHSVTFAGPVVPGASVSATFKVTSGAKPLNGDLTGTARWTDAASHHWHVVSRVEKVRNVLPVRINEFRIGTHSPANATDSFIELYNASSRSIDLSHWTLTAHPSQQAIFSSVKIPAGTRLAAGHYYLLGLSNSGLAAPASAGSHTLFVRSISGMKTGDRIQIGTGAHRETRSIAQLGTAAGIPTRLWQPLPDGPTLTIPAGSTNVPVQRIDGFVVGQKIALGYGSTYPTVPMGRERYEIATVTAVGKPGTQAYLATEAPAGAANIKVTSVQNITAGDNIRLDIDSVGHGIETVTVTKVGTAAIRARLVKPVGPGATEMEVSGAKGVAVGNQLVVATPAHQQTVTITAVETSAHRGARITFHPALRQSFPNGAQVIDPGTGLDLAAPLKFNHSANLPFSDRGTGISFRPATAVAHISNDPIQALGTGITLNQPLANSYAINAAVRDANDTTAGYQGSPAPDQWFGGPALTTQSPLFGHIITIPQGSLILRDAAGLVVDSLNYGGLVDPWAAEGYQGASGLGKDGCYAPTPGMGVSTGRYPNGVDTDSNCADFVTAPVTIMPLATPAGAKTIKVTSIEGFASGQTVHIGTGANLESAVIAKIGTPGATTLRQSISSGATMVPVAAARAFHKGQVISIGRGASRESAVVDGAYEFGPAMLRVQSPLAHSHPAGAPISGSGIMLTAPLTQSYAPGTQVVGSAPTPGAPNHYAHPTH
jgi:hypothetical protein